MRRPHFAAGLGRSSRSRAIGIGLLPWTIWLSASLRPEHETARWDIAWSGFDVGAGRRFLLTALRGLAALAVGGALAARDGDAARRRTRGSTSCSRATADELRTAIFAAVVAEMPDGSPLLLDRATAPSISCAQVRLHLAAARERPAESDLVGVLEVAADRQPAREARDADAAA